MITQPLSPTEPIVTLTKVTKTFSDEPVLKDCSLSLYPNRIYGLIGRSGAGKSTLLRLMMGIYIPTEGTCQVFGETPPRLSDDALSRIGYVHQQDELIGWMTGARFLGFVRSHYPRWNESLLESIITRLEIPLRSPIKDLSPGERGCLALAAALAHEPDLVILDEPPAGLDPFRRENFIAILREYHKGEGGTIVLCSHSISDLDRISDHLVVVHQHTITYDRPIESLKGMFRKVTIPANEAVVRSRFAEELSSSEKIIVLDAEPGTTRLILSQTMLRTIKAHAGVVGWDVEEEPVGLEEAVQVLMLGDDENSPFDREDTVPLPVWTWHDDQDSGDDQRVPLPSVLARWVETKWDNRCLAKIPRPKERFTNRSSFGSYARCWMREMLRCPMRAFLSSLTFASSRWVARRFRGRGLRMTVVELIIRNSLRALAIGAVTTHVLSFLSTQLQRDVSISPWYFVLFVLPERTSFAALMRLNAHPSSEKSYETCGDDKHPRLCIRGKNAAHLLLFTFLLFLLSFRPPLTVWLLVDFALFLSILGIIWLIVLYIRRDLSWIYATWFDHDVR